MTASSAKHHHSHEHDHEPAGYLLEVARECETRGLRLTPLRERVLELIAREQKPIKAYDLLDRLRGERDGAAPPTVYRALDFLLANGFIHKLESVNAFVACHHPSTAQHSVPFLICDRCHSAVELEDEQVVAALDERARALGFVPQAQTLEDMLVIVTSFSKDLTALIPHMRAFARGSLPEPADPLSDPPPQPEHGTLRAGAPVVKVRLAQPQSRRSPPSSSTAVP